MGGSPTVGVSVGRSARVRVSVGLSGGLPAVRVPVRKSAVRVPVREGALEDQDPDEVDQQTQHRHSLQSEGKSSGITNSSSFD